MVLPAKIAALATVLVLLPLSLALARGGISQPVSSDAASASGLVDDAAAPPRRAAPVESAVEERLDPTLPLSRAQQSLAACERHFQAGKALIADKHASEARVEFDRAVAVLLEVPEDIPDRALFDRRAEDYIRKIHKYDIEDLGAGESPEGLIFTQSPLNDLLELTFPVDPNLKDKVIERVRAASSQLPLDVNDAVLSYVNYFSSARGQRTFLYGWKRAGRYRPMIERVFREEGLPTELIHLAQAESGFMPRALSRKAAAGMWQFIRFTGGQYGLEATKAQDDRLDPEKATRAAAQHLRDLYRRSGDWLLAMAGYNCGALCVERAVQRTGYADFWELRRRSALPRETQNYIPAIIAMAIIAKDPSAYGLPAFDQDPELEFDTVPLGAATHLALLADAADASVAELRELNPSLLKSVAPADSEVRVPKGKGRVVQEALETVPAEKRAAWRLHRMSAGDSLASIAKRFSASPAAVLSANARLDAAWFADRHDGDLVLVPAAPRPEPVTKSARAKSSRGKRSATSTASSRSGGAKHATGRASSVARTSSSVHKKPLKAAAR